MQVVGRVDGGVVGSGIAAVRDRQRLDVVADEPEGAPLVRSRHRMAESVRPVMRAGRLTAGGAPGHQGSTTGRGSHENLRAPTFAVLW